MDVKSIHQPLIGDAPQSFNMGAYFSDGHPRGPSLDHLKLMIIIVLGASWVYQTFGDILASIVSNSHFGKRSAALVMTFSCFHFLPNDQLTGFGCQIFEILSKSIDLDVQMINF